MRKFLGNVLYYGTFKKLAALKYGWGVVIFHKGRAASVLATRKTMENTLGTEPSHFSSLLRFGGRYLP